MRTVLSWCIISLVLLKGCYFVWHPRQYKKTLHSLDWLVWHPLLLWATAVKARSMVCEYCVFKTCLPRLPASVFGIGWSVRNCVVFTVRNCALFKYFLFTVRNRAVFTVRNCFFKIFFIHSERPCCFHSKKLLFLQWETVLFSHQPEDTIPEHSILYRSQIRVISFDAPLNRSALTSRQQQFWFALHGTALSDCRKSMASPANRSACVFCGSAVCTLACTSGNNKGWGRGGVWCGEGLLGWG